MNDHMQAAIETAAEELHPGLFTLSDHRYSIRFDTLRTTEQSTKPMFLWTWVSPCTPRSPTCAK